MVTEVGTARGQLDESHTPLAELHLALITTNGNRVKLLPGTVQWSLVATKALMTALSVQRQVEISAHVKLNSWLQVNTVPVPPPSVLESNDTAMYEPSLENTALDNTGAGTG